MANDISCCRVILMAYYTIALTHQIHAIGTNTSDSTIGNTTDSTSIPTTGQQSTNTTLASTVTPPASTSTVPTVSPTPTSTCADSIKANCSRDFQHVYGNVTVDIHSCQSPTSEQCYQIFPTNNCTQLQAQLNTNGTFGLLCSPSGLQVFRYNSSCPVNVLSFLNSSTSTFCSWRGWNCTLDANSKLTKIDENTLLKPTNCPTTKKTATTDIPLTPNPVGPAAITAIVVLVCLTIVAILAGFFFWPKCHNPQAPPLKKKAPPPVDPTPQVAYSVSRKQATVSLPPGSIGHNAV